MIASMLSILAIWFVVAGLLIGLGASVGRLLAGARAQDLSTSFWLGWAVWIGLLQVLHVQVPLASILVPTLLVGLGCLGLLWNGSHLFEMLGDALGERRFLLALLTVFCAWLCNRSLGPLLSIDAGLYHLGAIKWASEAPLVEGLGNLHGRLAFNSTAFLWMSSLDRWPSLVRGFNVAPGLLLMAAMAQISQKIRLESDAAAGSKAGGHFHLRTFHLSLLLPLLYAATVMHVSSTSPDWIDLVLGVVLASELVALCTQETVGDARSRFLTIAAVCAAGMTVKLSFAALGASALVVAAFRISREPSNALRCLMPGLLLASFLLVPWSLRSIALSGYPAYPSTIGAVEVAWKIPEARARAEVRWIRSWARAPGKSPDEVLGNSDWIRPWLASRFRASDSIALLLFPAALFALGGLTSVLRRGGPSATTRTLAVPYAVAVLAWFVAAPDPRFLGSALWVCAGSLLAGMPGDDSSSSRFPVASKLAGVAALICAVGFLVFIAHMGSRVGGVFVSPGPSEGRYPLRRVETESFLTNSDLILQVPRRGDQCWEAPLPCTPYPAPRLKLRNKSEPLGGFELE